MRNTSDSPPLPWSCTAANISRGGKTETLEGDWKPNRLVILQFESSEQAKKWLNSDEYREARAMRLKTTKSQMVIIEGV